MNILLVTKNFPSPIGGSCIVYHNLALQLHGEMTVLTGLTNPAADRAWDAMQPYTVYRSTAFNPPPSSDANGRIHLVRRALRAYIYQRALATINSLAVSHRVRPDIICVGDLYLYWLVGLLRRALRVPTILYVHGEEIANPFSSRLTRSSSLDAVRQADGVIAVSEFTRNSVFELGVKRERTSLIPNGVDIDFFTPGEPDHRLIDEFGLAGKCVLLTVGRLEPRKGHSTVITALPEILRSVPDLVYVIAGSDEGVEAMDLMGQAQQAGVKDRVVFTGKVSREQLLALYRRCDLFAMPNRRLPNGDTEGFGLVFLEAGACRKPVIGGRDGGVPEAVRDGKTGLLVDGNDPKQFAKAAISVLTQPAFAAELADAGYQFAQTMKWQNTAHRFHEFCEYIKARPTLPVEHALAAHE